MELQWSLSVPLDLPTESLDPPYRSLPAIYQNLLRVQMEEKSLNSLYRTVFENVRLSVRWQSKNKQVPAAGRRGRVPTKILERKWDKSFLEVGHIKQILLLWQVFAPPPFVLTVEHANHCTVAHPY